MSRIETLGYSWNGQLSAQESFDHETEEYEKYKESPEIHIKRLKIKFALDATALYHLECIQIPEFRQYLQDACSMCVGYFCDNWWTAEAFERLSDDARRNCNLTNMEDIKGGVETNAIALDKGHPERDLVWHSGLTGALLFGGLLNKWDEVSRACGWFDETIEPEYSAGTVEDDLFYFFICVAGQLGPLPFDRFAKLAQKVQKSRLKRPRLLFRAWEAAVKCDQHEFDNAFVASLKHFLSRKEEQGHAL